MPNRRASRNAYYFFVQEKIPDLRRRGLPVARVADAIPYCSADWAVRLEGTAGRAVGREGGREEGGLEETSDPAAPAAGRGRPPVPQRANRRRNRRPGMSKHLPTGPGPSGLTAASLSSPPFDVPKLLREEEKEKYADMAREWRAAQGKDAGLSEKQVKAARLLGSFGKCWTRGRGCRARPAGALGWHRGGVRVSPGVSQQAPYLVTGAQSGVLWLRSPGRPHWKPAATGAVAFGFVLARGPPRVSFNSFCF